MCIVYDKLLKPRQSFWIALYTPVYPCSGSWIAARICADGKRDGYKELLSEFLQTFVKNKSAVVKWKYRLAIKHKTFLLIMHQVWAHNELSITQ